MRINTYCFLMLIGTNLSSIQYAMQSHEDNEISILTHKMSRLQRTTISGKDSIIFMRESITKRNNSVLQKKEVFSSLSEAFFIEHIPDLSEINDNKGCFLISIDGILTENPFDLSSKKGPKNWADHTLHTPMIKWVQTVINLNKKIVFWSAHPYVNETVAFLQKILVPQKTVQGPLPTKWYNKLALKCAECLPSWCVKGEPGWVHEISNPPQTFYTDVQNIQIYSYRLASGIHLIGAKKKNTLYYTEYAHLVRHLISLTDELSYLVFIDSNLKNLQLLNEETKEVLDQKNISRRFCHYLGNKNESTIIKYMPKIYLNFQKPKEKLDLSHSIIRIKNNTNPPVKISENIEDDPNENSKQPIHSFLAIMAPPKNKREEYG